MHAWKKILFHLVMSVQSAAKIREHTISSTNQQIETQHTPFFIDISLF